MFNFNHLRSFYQAAKLLNITHAAKSLYISQPAVTHQVKQLEQYCQFKLFKKKGHNIYLTDEGKILFEYTMKIFEMEKNLQQCIEDIHDKKGGCLHIGLVRIYSERLIPILLKKFHSIYHGIKIQLDEGNSLEICKNLLNYKDSVAIVAKVMDDPNMCLIPLFREQLVLVSAPNYHLNKKKRVLFQELIGEPIILKEVGSGVRKLVDDCFGKEKENLNVIVEANNMELIKEMVKSGNGVAFMIKGTITKELKARELSIIPIENQRLFLPMYLAYLVNHPLSLTAKLFIDFMKSFLHPDEQLLSIETFLSRILKSSKS